MIACPPLTGLMNNESNKLLLLVLTETDTVCHVSGPGVIPVTEMVWVVLILQVVMLVSAFIVGARFCPVVMPLAILEK